MQKNVFFYEAIILEEFKLWIERVISELELDDIPLYFFDLLEFNDGIAKITRIIGYQPHGNLTKEEEDAIFGIAFLRGDVYDSDISRDSAIKALIKNHHIYEKYKIFFPFIELPDLNKLNDFKNNLHRSI